MLAYHNRPELKHAFLVELAWHRAQDKLLKGNYWQDGRGCAVGCSLASIAKVEGLTTIQHDDHALYESHLGIPRVLARLEDLIFERLPNDLAQQWPERFARAIRPGADLSMVGPKFLHNLLSDPAGGVQKCAQQRPLVKASIQRVIDLYGRWIEGTKPSVTEWREARNAAAAAAYAAAAYADAADAADADAPAYAAAADAAADAAATATAERIRQADALIALLEAA